MKKRIAAACALAAAAAMGISACSSGGGAGSLPDGIASSSCKFVWEGDDSYANVTQDFPTESAAQHWVDYQYQQDEPEYQAGGGTGYPSIIGGDPPEEQSPYQVADFSITAGQTVDVGSITAAYYTKSGTEISSSRVAIDETLTSGQSGSTRDINPPSNAASCQIVAWTPGG